ncbi:MAG: AgmX/PglI C-terminal domain-containing protein [Myxococcales bacterium]|nr:AgmX/PglI C-terminal domain-containing protein [Myxococcales bacterium]
MVECPFCGSEVTEDLVTYGGTCPKCFAEIPGDEAPTDPGAEVRAAQERKDRRGRTLRMAFAFSLLLALVSCTGVTALGVVLWPKPEVAEMLDFDNLDVPLPDLVGAPSGELGGATAPSSGPKPRPSGPKPPSSVGGTPSVNPVTSVPVAEPTSGTGTRPRPQPGAATGPADPTQGGTTSTRPGGLDDLTIGGPAVRRDSNTVLSDPDAIRMMIGERLREQIPGLQVCYDRRLKVDSTLKGRWLLTFNVQPSGKVSGATANGLDRKDATLEQCLTHHVETNWVFGKINVTQPVRRTITFRN